GRPAWRASAPPLPPACRVPRAQGGSGPRKNGAQVMITVLLLLGLSPGAAPSVRHQQGEAVERATIRVGVDEGDFRGADHRVLQAAIDYVAGLGGGTVKVGPGRYVLRNAVTLRN